MKALNEALDRVEVRYKTKIRLKKNELSKALRAENNVLLPGVRIVSAARLETVLPAVEKAADQLNDFSQPNFGLKPDFVPPLGRKQEGLSEVRFTERTCRNSSLIIPRSLVFRRN